MVSTCLKPSSTIDIYSSPDLFLPPKRGEKVGCVLCSAYGNPLARKPAPSSFPVRGHSRRSHWRDGCRRSFRVGTDNKMFPPTCDTGSSKGQNPFESQTHDSNSHTGRCASPVTPLASSTRPTNILNYFFNVSDSSMSGDSFLSRTAIFSKDGFSHILIRLSMPNPLL